MSVLIKVSRFGAQDRLFYFREIQVTLGETEAGILASSEIKSPYFTLGMMDDRTLIQIERDGLSLQGSPIEKGMNCAITSGMVLKGHDYVFTFLLTQTSSEILARIDSGSLQELTSHLKKKELPQLKFQLAHWIKTFPLLEGVSLHAGSDLDDAIFLDCPGVQPHHFVICNQGDVVHVQTRVGVLKNANGLCTQSAIVERPGDLILDPPGIRLQFEFPPTPGSAPEVSEN